MKPPLRPPTSIGDPVATILKAKAAHLHDQSTQEKIATDAEEDGLYVGNMPPLPFHQQRRWILRPLQIQLSSGFLEQRVPDPTSPLVTRRPVGLFSEDRISRLGAGFKVSQASKVDDDLTEVLVEAESQNVYELVIYLKNICLKSHPLFSDEQVGLQAHPVSVINFIGHCK